MSGVSKGCSTVPAASLPGFCAGATSEETVSNTECEREIETLDAVSNGTWPAACDDALRDHVTCCAACSDLTEVAAALLDDRDAALRDAPLPPSGLVWWRMQM